jgi:hypothetical protein
MRPEQGVVVQRRRLGTELDPSCDSPERFITKVGLDATVPLSAPRPVSRNRVSQELLDSIDLSTLLAAP